MRKVPTRVIQIAAQIVARVESDHLSVTEVYQLIQLLTEAYDDALARKLSVDTMPKMLLKNTEG